MHAKHLNPPVLASYRSVPASGRLGTLVAPAAVPRKEPGTLPGFAWKRLLDLLLIILSLPLILPLVAVAALWVKSVSRGPAFFRQERIGRNGKKFTLYKLRSMEVSAGTAVHRDHVQRLMESNRPMIKLDRLGDSRFIPGGRFLRSTGLDELPQLFNVLSGKMSLVGPRPCLPYEYDLYSPRQRGRFDVPPGLTGLWQVNGKNSVTFREMNAMDLYYSRNASLWVDLMILSKTPMAMGRQVFDDLRDHRRRSAPLETGAAVLIPLALQTAKSE